MLIAPNNIFMDMVVLFIRYFWLAIIFLPHVTSPVYAIRLLLLIRSFYLTLEGCPADFSYTVNTQERRS